MQHEARSIALPSTLTELQRRILTDLHCLSHAAHDTTDGLLALAQVLLDKPSRAHDKVHHTLSTLSVMTMKKIGDHVCQASPTLRQPGSPCSPLSPLQRALSAFGPSFPDSNSSDWPSDSDDGGGRRVLPRRGSSNDGDAAASPQQWTTSTRQRLQLLDQLADTYRTGHPWVAAFVLALSRYEGRAGLFLVDTYFFVFVKKH